MTDKKHDNIPSLNVPPAERERPGPVHEALWAMIEDRVAAMVQEYAPTFGTVTGMDGGHVKVHVDGESEPRSVGMPRHRGQRYEKGDRVKVQKSRSGEEFVDGSFGSKSGKDPVVGTEDVNDDSIQQNHIDKAAVGSEQIATGNVQTKHLDSKSVTNDKIGDSAVDTKQLKGNSVTGDKIASGAVDTSQLKDNAVTKNKLDKNAVDLSDYVKTNDLNRALDGFVKAGQLAPHAMGNSALATEDYVDKKVKDAKSSNKDNKQ